jgi:murein L,D-transpeptidase YafK
MRALFTTIFLQLATLVWGQTDLPLAESVLVDKSERKMWLIHEGRKYREYDISLGDSPVGHKEREGDEKTPEGSYIIDYRNPESRFYLSLHISYPREEDEEKAQRKGVMPGGNIFIHGLPNGLEKMSSSYVGRDWTDGCIAVSNQAIEELWVLVQDGTPIEILH